jgi:hypothetical protein
MARTPDPSTPLRQTEPPRPHGDILENEPPESGDAAGREPAGESQRDRPPGPTGDMDQPGMNPEAEGQE